jgi:hypothetical protein
MEVMFAMLTLAAERPTSCVFSGGARFLRTGAWVMLWFGPCSGTGASSGAGKLVCPSCVVAGPDAAEMAPAPLLDAVSTG